MAVSIAPIPARTPITNTGDLCSTTWIRWLSQELMGTLETNLTTVQITGAAGLCQGRLTLASGYPVYSPIAMTPSSTDTGTEIVTFATAHGWKNGTIVTPLTTGGNLTQGTRYYINAPSTTTASFHTTVAAAMAGTSKVDLTASITSVIKPSGISATTLYYTPYKGSIVTLFDGSSWVLSQFTEISVALGTLTSDLPYDVFIYLVGSTLTLELVAWTSTFVRAADLVMRDGIKVKDSTGLKRYVGTICTDSTTTTIDDAGGLIGSNVGGIRYVYNEYNQVERQMFVVEITTWTYATATWRAARGSTANRVKFVAGSQDGLAKAFVRAVHNINANGDAAVGVGLNMTDANHALLFMQGTLATQYVNQLAEFQDYVPPGANYLQWVENSLESKTLNFSSGVNCGMVANWLC